MAAAQERSTPLAQEKLKVREFYQSYLDAYNDQDWDRMQQFYASPHVLVDGEPRAPSQLIELAKSMVLGFANWRLEIWHFAVDGDLVYVHLKLGGTHTATFRGVKPTNRRVDTTELSLYRLVDGKFTEIWPMLNMEAIMNKIQE
ncbi:NTF2-like protein [Nemania sp. FL0031]|nr:NTF2-like protein [Nemania sp. FL0031]